MKKLLFSMLAVAMIGCQQNIDQKAEADKLMATSREWAQAASGSDIEKIVNYWADDAVVISAGEQPRRGKADIRKMVEEGMNAPGFSITWEPKSAVVSESGDLGYLIEESQMTMADSTGNKNTIKFNNVSVWRKQADGSWKNVVDISTPQEMPH